MHAIAFSRMRRAVCVTKGGPDLSRNSITNSHIFLKFGGSVDHVTLDKHGVSKVKSSKSTSSRTSTLVGF